jgi:D-inositol-3-phosphate glycosyltransferase
MKIAFYCATIGLGGLELNLLKLYDWMTSRGHEIIIFAVEGSPLHIEAESLSYNVLAVQPHGKYFDFFSAFKIKKQLVANNINNLVAFDNADLDMLGYAKNFMVNKLNMIYLQQMQMGTVKKDFFHTMRYSKLNAWITPLNHLAEEIRTMTKFNMDKVHVVPLCINPQDLLDNKYEKNEARDILSIPQNAITLGIIGRIDEFKRQMILVEAAKNLREEGIDINVLIVGEPTRNLTSDYYQQILDYIDLHDLSDRIFIRPFTKDVASFYSAIDIFAMTSSGETFGMVTVEAMLFGVPVIGSDGGGTPEILDFGKYGTIFKTRNQAAFDEKLQYMLDNKSEIDEKAKLAESYAKEAFSNKIICDKLEKLCSAI